MVQMPARARSRLGGGQTLIRMESTITYVALLLSTSMSTMYSVFVKHDLQMILYKARTYTHMHACTIYCKIFIFL